MIAAPHAVSVRSLSSHRLMRVLGTLFGGKALQHREGSFAAAAFAFRAQPDQDCFVVAPNIRVGSLEAHQKAKCHRHGANANWCWGWVIDCFQRIRAWFFDEQFLNHVVLDSGCICIAIASYRKHQYRRQCELHRPIPSTVIEQDYRQGHRFSPPIQGRYMMLGMAASSASLNPKS